MEMSACLHFEESPLKKFWEIDVTYQWGQHVLTANIYRAETAAKDLTVIQWGMKISVLDELTQSLGGPNADGLDGPI